MKSAVGASPSSITPAEIRSQARRIVVAEIDAIGNHAESGRVLPRSVPAPQRSNFREFLVSQSDDVVDSQGDAGA